MYCIGNICVLYATTANLSQHYRICIAHPILIQYSPKNLCSIMHHIGTWSGCNWPCLCMFACTTATNINTIICISANSWPIDTKQLQMICTVSSKYNNCTNLCLDMFAVIVTINISSTRCILTSSQPIELKRLVMSWPCSVCTSECVCFCLFMF